VNRRIISSEDVVIGVDRLPDGYFDRVLKCIPVEVVTVYVLLASAAQTAFAGRTLQWWLFLLVVAGTVAAPTYARSALAIRRYSQLAMTTAAFLVVAAVTGGWFATLDWWNGFFPVLATVAFGVTVAMLGFGPARSRPVSPPGVPASRQPGDDAQPAGPADPTESIETTGAGEPAVGAEAEEEESGLLRVWRGSGPPG
jgi:hypothetical protein